MRPSASEIHRFWEESRDKRFGAVLRQLLAQLVVRTVGNARSIGDLGNRFATGLNQPHGFSLKFLGVCLLRFCHNPDSPLETVYPKLSLVYKTREDHRWSPENVGRCPLDAFCGKRKPPPRSAITARFLSSSL